MLSEKAVYIYSDEMNEYIKLQGSRLKIIVTKMGNCPKKYKWIWECSDTRIMFWSW